MLDSLFTKIRVSGAIMVAALVLCTYALTHSPILLRVDLMLYDYFLNWQKHKASNEVLIVAIDDTSLQKLGRWPWSRSLQARLLDRLTDMEARAVGFDILFAERQLDDPLADQALAQAITRNGRTVLALAPSNPHRGEPIREVLPIPELAIAANRLGHVDIEIDIDGLSRSFFLQAGIGDAHWPALSLAVLQAGRDEATSAPAASGRPAGPLDAWVRQGRLLIPFDPRSDSLETVSAHEVLSDDGTRARIAGKYVLIGSTATGLGDVVSTPVSVDHQRMPGVELNGHILSGLLKGNLVSEMPAPDYRMLSLAVTAVAAIWMISMSFPAAILLFLLNVAGILALSAVVLYGWQTWFPPAAAIAPLIVGFPLWGAWSLLQEKRINRSLTVRMQHQALHHSATNLPNQYVLEERLRLLSKENPEGPALAALIIVHIKWSGSAGSIVGRSAGDRMLSAIADRLRNAVRSDDLVAHLSGDDFGILVSHLSDQDSALRIANTLRNALKEPLDTGNTQISLSPRMGMSVWPSDSPDPDALLRDAYIAMFRARIEQSSQPCFYSDEIAREVQARSRLEQSLLSALQRDEFEVYYQPQVITGSGRVIGVEALLRWHNPELGLVYPGTFIPVAEHSGLIHQIGGWVLRTACAQVQQWNSQGLGPLRLAVNLSPLQFADEQLLPEVSRALEESGLEPHKLELEITESTLMQNMEQATSAMRALKERGVKLAIDDFGTGYSSLSNLQHFPLDRIKIDQSFTREIHNNEGVREITLTIITMAKRLKLETIAEGVETELQASFLGDKGCDELQGYYFSHPLPATELSELLKRVMPGNGAVPGLKAGSINSA